MQKTPFSSTHSALPKAPPVPEEPLENMPKSELVCEICGKTSNPIATRQAQDNRDMKCQSKEIKSKL